MNSFTENDYPFKSNVTKPSLLFSLDTLPVHANDASLGNCDVSNRPLINTQLTSVGTFSQQGRRDFSVASAGNKILIAGGATISKPYGASIVDIFDVKTNSWSTAELSQGRFGIATAVLDNKIFFAGGANTLSGTISRVDIYDAESNTIVAM